MNIQLREYNEFLLSIEEYYIDYGNTIINMDDKERIQWTKKMQEASKAYEQVIEKMTSVIFSLTPAEIVIGYEDGCKLLQRNLGGFMRGYFNELYVEPMKSAIRDDHETAYLFLGCLSEHLEQGEFENVLLDALDGESIRKLDTSLAFARKLKIVEALPKVLALTSHSDPSIKRLAGEVASVLEEEKANRC